MRLSGFTRMGAMIGFFGAIALIFVTAFQIDSEEVSRKNVILTEIVFVMPFFTMIGAALGAGWDFFEKRSGSRVAQDSLRVEDTADPDNAPPPNPPPNPPRRRRKPPGGRRQH